MKKEFEFILKEFDTKNFPENLCKDKSTVEEGILESQEEYICVIEDSRFDFALRLEIMCPYIFKSGKKMLHGWYSKNFGGLFFSSKYNPIHPEDDEFVIAWKKI
jgi:hypothetical protein